MIVGERVRRAREKLGISQRQLAEKAGTTQATVSRIESSQIKELRAGLLLRLATELRTTTDFLLGKTDKMTSDDYYESDPEARYVFMGYERLSPTGKEQLEVFLNFLEKQEEREKGDR